MIVDFDKQKTGYGANIHTSKKFGDTNPNTPVSNLMKKVDVKKKGEQKIEMSGVAHDVEAQRWITSYGGKIYGQRVPDLIEPTKRQTGYGDQFAGLDSIGMRYAKKQNEVVRDITSKYSFSSG